MKKYGSQCSFTPKIRIRIRPIQKYGITVMITKIGGMMLSSRPPRRQAPRIPIAVPRTKARIVVSPTSASVQGMASSTIRPTDTPGWVVSETPN